METFHAGAAVRPNPFAHDLARANSTYLAYQDNMLVRVLDRQPPEPLHEFVHDSFRALVLNPKFTCVATKSAINHGAYRMGVYRALATPAATAGLAYDLYHFVQEQPSLSDGFSTFVAGFTGPTIVDEQDFERLLWAQLQALHDLDHPNHAWDATVSSDPGDNDFSFSFAGRAFFLVRLHAGSSRWTRRFAWPTLVSNAHAQFEQLRADERYERMQHVIRERDRALQGSINTNLSYFGQRSEARQYSGHPVEDGWKCPFLAHTQNRAA